MAKRNNGFQNVWVLFPTATLVLSAAGLMKSFPLLIFIGLAPLFAISDLAKEKTSPWNHLEIILLSFTVSLFCANLFHSSNLIMVLVQSILLTFAFAGYAFAYQNLGPRLGKFTIIFFWLGLEYLMLKLPWRNDFRFLADALELKPGWWRWNHELGYLSISIWILVVNLFFYLALFKYPSWIWFFVTMAALFIAGPIVYSVHFLNEAGINNGQMLALYNDNGYPLDTYYAKRGEWITRSAAWVSILILLLAVVKNKTKKK